MRGHGLGLIAALALLGSLGAALAETNLTAMSPDEITALQRRLTDAGCYTGAVDGTSSAATVEGVKACPDMEPMLRIETGMHTGMIWRIGVDAGCKLLATGSNDKTVRLWSMPEGRLIRTQRLPIDSGNGGKVYAVAVSPDGSLVAAGGWDAFDSDGVYLFDSATGEHVRRLGNFENVVNDIAFSPDGQRLAVALGHGGIRVLDVASGKELLADEALAGAASGAGQVFVPLPNKAVTVSLIARAGDLVSEPATIKLAWGGQGGDLLKPKLYAVVVGVSQYADSSLALHYAAKDAADFAAALRAQGGGLYGGVEVKLLTDAEATRDNIIDELDWLDRQVTSHDVGIVYLAGHGMTDERQQFWFLPVAATVDRVKSRGVAKDDIQRALDGLAGKAVLFLDACHSASALAGATARGAVDINAVINDFTSAEHGVVAFSSSQGREVSFERDDWGNGAFTKALVEGLEGKGDVLGTGQITLSGLDVYIVNRVKQLTDGHQHPVMTRPSTVSDFPIGVVRK